MRAWSLIREQPLYRHEAFLSGLKAAGYEIGQGRPKGAPGNVLIGWNRYGYTEQLCDQFEASGGTVLIAENGYINGRHDGGSYYALSRHAHNGAGEFYVGGPERWQALGVDLKPWRTAGTHILIAPNRSFGMRGMVMPYNWADDVTKRLEKVTDRPIRLRQHPGNGVPQTPLCEDLRDCWALVIWSSSVGVKALIEGIPVVCEAPYWICKAADVLGGIGMLECEEGNDSMRRSELECLAWGQWNVDEITSGEPFHHLLKEQREAVTS